MRKGREIFLLFVHANEQYSGAEQARVSAKSFGSFKASQNKNFFCTSSPSVARTSALIARLLLNDVSVGGGKWRAEPLKAGGDTTKMKRIAWVKRFELTLKIRFVADRGCVGGVSKRRRLPPRERSGEVRNVC